jgi:signal transduction histidine kinase
MTLDPSPPVLGNGAVTTAAGGAAVGAPVGPGGVDDEVRLRADARRQWSGRRALERQLHDGAALRISALALRLGLLRHTVPGAGPDFRTAVEDLQDELHLVLQELRDVAGQLYPPLLDEAGLGPALREVGARCPVPVRVDAPEERFGPAAEGAAYFAVLGCLDRPGEGGWAGGPVDVVVRRDGDVLVLLVSGVDACHAGSVHDGVRLLGGTVSVDATATGRPITVRIPCA